MSVKDTIRAPDSEPKSAQPCLFLSHAGIDSAAAMALAERIEQSPEAQRRGLTVWVDKLALKPGEPWLDQLEAAILNQSTAFAIYLTKAGAENWVRMEVRAALDRAVAAGRKGEVYPFIPIIAESGFDIEVLAPFARQFQGIRLADPDAVQQLIGAMLERPAATVALVDEPFLGLEAFGAKDAHLFFGRDQETEELIERLQQTNFVMVVGDSGSGKSSLVKADLVPAFKEGRFAPRLGPRPDPALWHVVEMRPAKYPFEGLIDSISEAARTQHVDYNPAHLGEARDRLRAKQPAALRDALREGAPPGAQVLLIVDQFEELWTQSDDPNRQAFLDAVLDLARPGDPSRRVVMTMRRDYYNLCSTHEKFFRRIEEQDRRGFYNLRRMNDEALRACIERPLALAGVPPADARRLADEVLHDAGDQAGDLALIEMALTETWQERSNHRGDLLAAYVAIGRVEGAIRKAADEVYAALGERQSLAEPLFMRLVRLGDTGGTTRRIMHADEFGSDSGLWRLAQHLGSKDGKRLLVLGRETAELAHEQLVTQWPQFQRWLQGTETDPRAVDKRTLDQLVEQTRRWQERGRKRRDLATGSALLEYGSVARRRKAWLAPIEASFVKRSRWRAQINTAAIVTVIVAVLTVGTWAFLDQRQRAQEAERRRIEAEATSIGFQLELQNGQVGARDVGALVALASAGRDERLAFVDELLERPSLAARFARNPEIVTRALVGVDPSGRRQVITHAFGPQSATPEKWDVLYARALLGIELGATEGIGKVLAAITETTDPGTLVALVEGLATLRVESAPEQARQAIELVLAAMTRTTDPYAVGVLGKGLAALPVESAPEQARQAIELVLAAMTRTRHPPTVEVLCEALAALPVGLTDEQAWQAIDPVLYAMIETRDPRALRVLGQRLGTLPVAPHSGIKAEQVTALLDTMLKSSGPGFLWALAEFPLELTNEQARRAIVSVVAAIERADFYDAWALTLGFAAFAGKLTDEQALQAIETLLGAMTRATDSIALRGFGEGLAALAPKLTDEQARQATELVLAAMTRSTEPHAVGVLGEVLAALPVGLTDEQARQAIALVLTGLKADTSTDASALGAGLAALAPKLADEQVGRATALVLAAMQGATAPKALVALGHGLATLAPKLTDEQARQATELVLAAMTRTEPHGVGVLGEVLAALPVGLTDEQARQAIALVLTGLKADSSPKGLDFGSGLPSARALAALAPKLTDEQVWQAIEPVLAAMTRTNNSISLRGFGEVLAALPVGLTPEQIRKAIEAVLAATKFSSGPESFIHGGGPPADRFRNLGQGLAALATRLAPWEAELAVAPILTAMVDRTDPDALRALDEGLAALTAKLVPERAVQTLVDALKIPWMAGAPSEPLLTALQARLGGAGAPQVGLWDTITEIEQRFGSSIDLTSPPKGLE